MQHYALNIMAKSKSLWLNSLTDKLAKSVKQMSLLIRMLTRIETM